MPFGYLWQGKFQYAWLWLKRKHTRFLATLKA
ncbi:hypothetical protein Vch1786_I0613 [Vibrio cholerae O1 str. 2010EL-1786]|uniref:Uncharacterized protein n=2 Tax=Vibrio cholerae TaxID=666 RepID=Q9KSZ7_VIBCH|nr:hypothetical protein VC_1109 [Vibrio cholerae O1 biovar El Tor str. N16961]ACP05382.1 conserved hypothetical protein [Vibrio cholerae M66-2]ACP09134.1 conserved hypothetical protein [Vibrio cholerae O395]AET26221.1 hypothetical protein Vch1786_I0613 [Vibrio cholerae O1 str. 2010EL-1786]